MPILILIINAIVFAIVITLVQAFVRAFGFGGLLLLGLALPFLIAALLLLPRLALIARGVL